MRLLRWCRGHLFVLGLFVAAGAAAVVAGSTWLSQGQLGTASADVSLVVPTAPRLTASGPDQHVYRIDASRSSATYSVTETIAGVDRTATGSTSGIAGDLLIDRASPSQSRLGDVVVNVEQLRSDEDLRDRRLRGDYLDSDRYPLVTFHTSRIDGLPTALHDGESHPVHITGDLTVKDAVHPVTLDATVTNNGDEVQVIASTTVRMSDLGIGPISIVGLVKTGDDVHLAFDLRAVPAERGVPGFIAAPVRSANTAGPAGTVGGTSPSFARDIEPMLASSCASCHAPGGVGSHSWTLDTASDAASVASGLALVTRSGYMPPWPAGDASVPLQHDRRLASEQIQAITTWAAAGAPLDVDPSSPVRATADAAGPTIRHDVTMTLPEPYQGTTDRPDDYRCFVLDPKLDHDAAVTGFEFTPDQAALVHHAVIVKVTAPGRTDIDHLDSATPGAGWGCSVGAPLTISTTGPAPASSGGGVSTQVSAWAPGQAATTYPDGVGLHLARGDFFLIQIHYHVAHPPPPDRSSFSIQLSDAPNLDDVKAATYFAPVEIPCATDQTGPLCDRRAVLDQLGQQFGPTAPLLPTGILAACTSTPDAFAAMTSGTAHSSCTTPVSNPGPVLWMMGHEHELGASFRLTVNAGRPDQRVILDIPRWSFNWQLIYQPAGPLDLHAGDTITTECSWDRSLRPRDPPRYITWAEGTQDEMCMGIIATRTAPPP